jgi:hypothetical protein
MLRFFLWYPPSAQARGIASPCFASKIPWDAPCFMCLLMVPLVTCPVEGLESCKALAIGLSDLVVRKVLGGCCLNECFGCEERRMFGVVSIGFLGIVMVPLLQ